MASRYDAGGPQAEFEPGSRGRVLRNRMGIRRVREMQHAESDALVTTQNALLDVYTLDHRFTASDIRQIHWLWLAPIYAWAGEYRTVNVSKGGFMFAAAGQVPRLMQDFERRELAQETPCQGMDNGRLARALARTHAELVLIHPFREGNGRCARVLAYLMAVQSGLPSLDFSPMTGRGRAAYFGAIQSAMGGDYTPLENVFAKPSRRHCLLTSRRRDGLVASTDKRLADALHRRRTRGGQMDGLPTRPWLTQMRIAAEQFGCHGNLNDDDLEHSLTPCQEPRKIRTASLHRCCQARRR